jgi:La-related protein 7
VGKFPKYNKQLAQLEEKLSKTETEEEKMKRKLTKTNDDVIDAEPANKEQKLNDNDENKKKKNRRRKNSVLKAKKMEKEIAEEATLLHLRVISKKEWLRLKKDYLERQKSNLSELKAKLKSIKSAEEDNERPKAKKQKTEEPKFIVDDSFKNCIIKLTPKNTFDETTYELFKLSRQQFKNEKLKEFSEQIAYVDIDKNLNRIFVRCKDKVAAEDLKSKTEYLNDFNMDLLVGSEEYEYVSKIASNRDKKHEKKAKKENRGKEKVN